MDDVRQAGTFAPHRSAASLEDVIPAKSLPSSVLVGGGGIQRLCNATPLARRLSRGDDVDAGLLQLWTFTEGSMIRAHCSALRGTSPCRSRGGRIGASILEGSRVACHRAEGSAGFRDASGQGS